MYLSPTLRLATTQKSGRFAQRESNARGLAQYSSPQRIKEPDLGRGRSETGRPRSEQRRNSLLRAAERRDRPSQREDRPEVAASSGGLDSGFFQPRVGIQEVAVVAADQDGGEAELAQRP